MKTTTLSQPTLRKVEEKPHTESIYFHVFNRGINGQAIFTSKDNYEFLLKRVEEYSAKFRVAVLAYCLMPTHYHFLVETGNREQASKFVQTLFNSYSQAFNQQQDRKGPLFEGRANFKAINTNEYALEICSYIHLNPVKAGLVKKPEEWKYSNYHQWVEHTEKQDTFVMRFFDSPKEYEEYVKFNLAKGGK